MLFKHLTRTVQAALEEAEQDALQSGDQTRQAALAELHQDLAVVLDKHFALLGFTRDETTQMGRFTTAGGPKTPLRS